MPNIKFVRADGKAMPLEKMAEFADFMGGCINTKTAEMANVVFDVRKNLKDSEYKELSEMRGKIREMADCLHEVTSMFAKGLSGMGEICDKQEKNLYEGGVLLRTAQQLLKEKKEERPIICSCGNKYVSMVGLKRHRKKKKCPTLRQDS